MLTPKTVWVKLLDMANNVAHVADFTNAETGMTAFVVASTRGGFNVVLHDDDADEYIPTWVNVKDVDDAIVKAKGLVAL